MAPKQAVHHSAAALVLRSSRGWGAMMEGGNVTVVILSVLAIFAALFLILGVVVMSRALIVRIALRRFLQLLRRSRRLKFGRISSRSRRAVRRPRRIVGTSSFAAIRRIGRPRTYTERTLDLISKKSEVTESVLDDVLKDYDPEDPDADIDERVESFIETVDNRWQQHTDRILEAPRRALFEKYKPQIIRRFGESPESILKDAYLENGSPKISGETLTFEMIDFNKVEFSEFSSRQQEWLIAESAFTEAEKDLKRRGVTFTEMRALAGFIPDQEQITREMSFRNYLKATNFFRYNVKVDNDPDLLYEDVNDAAIAEMIGISDRRTLYYLTNWRKIVNKNVFILSVILSSILAVFLMCNFLYGWIISSKNYVFADFETLLSGVEWTFLSNNIELADRSLNKWIFALLTAIPAYLLALFIYRFPYSHFQRVNNAQLLSFMNFKTARMSQHFFSAESQARGAFSGAEMNPGSREMAKIWFINMQWIAFRLLNIEMFLRSILYQVRRNSGYYVLGIPTLFLFTMFCTMIVIFVLDPESWHNWPYAGQWWWWLIANGPFIVLFFWLAYIVVGRRYLSRCAEELMDIDEATWQNFQDFDVQRLSGGLVRHYVGEIFNERMRVRGSGGGGHV